MIGKPQWFTYRIFGWGLRPKTKEGWYYIGVFILLLLGVAYLPIQETLKLYAMIALVVILILDTLHIMAQLPKVSDERENYHQLIIERNASFAAIFAIIAIAFYQAFKNCAFTTNYQGLPFDMSLIIVLLVMVVAKILTTVYTKMRM
jgi:uncharacterized membrane protein (DUF485 family)